MNSRKYRNLGIKGQLGWIARFDFPKEEFCMRKKVFLLGIAVVSISFILTGCVPGDGTATIAKPAGFLWGVWHGWLAPVSLLIGLFNKDVRVYEIINTGWWYDLGFYIAVISGFGSISLSRKKSKEKKE